jgi:hypothetical protein
MRELRSSRESEVRCPESEDGRSHPAIPFCYGEYRNLKYYEQLKNKNDWI